MLFHTIEALGSSKANDSSRMDRTISGRYVSSYLEDNYVEGMNALISH